MYPVLSLIHVIAAITWLGGMLFLAMVMAPVARRDAGAGFGTLRAAKKEAFTLLSLRHWSTCGKSPEFIYLAVQERFSRAQRT